MEIESPLYKFVARLSYILTFVHFFRNKVRTKSGDCLYLYFEALVMVCEVHKVEASRVLVSQDVATVTLIRINSLLQDLGFFTLVWLRIEVPVM